MDPDEHLPHDESLPWGAGSEIDVAYREQIRAGLRAGRTLLQAELEAMAAVAHRIPEQDKTPLSDAFAPPEPELLAMPGMAALFGLPEPPPPPPSDDAA